MDILRRTRLHRGWEQEPFGFGYFPLAPYSNRIRHGSFRFEGKEIHINPNAPGHANPMHGTAWRGSWFLVAHSSQGARLEYEHKADREWPWAFALAQEIKIEGDFLYIKLRIKNESASVMPAGLGFHPYFPDPGMARLQFSAKGSWRPDEDGLPVEWRSVGEDYDFSAGRSLADVRIDRCFTDWRGPALIEWRDKPIRLEISADQALGFAVVYVSQEEKCFCFEPVSHMNGALNWASQRSDTGLRVLAPGEEWTATMTLRVISSLEKQQIINVE